MTWKRFFEPDVLVFMIPIVAIIVGGIVAIVRRVISHRERMAMIEHGIHPDYPPEELESAEQGGVGPNVLDETGVYDRS